jgi:CheY-like chemotaxis protein
LNKKFEHVAQWSNIMKILAVDDEPIVLELLKSSMTAAGYDSMEFASSAYQALRMTQTATVPFDCFFLDILMPGMNGIELCARIREIPDYKDTPIIMLTKMDDKSFFDLAFSAGATDYVTKPFDPVELLIRAKIADKMSRTQNKLQSSDIKLMSLEHRLERQNKLSIRAPFLLDNCPGSIEILALENYLLRLAKLRHNMTFFAVKLENVEDLFCGLTSIDFRETVNLLGDVLAENLKTQKYFLSYAGDGVFAIAITNGSSLDYEYFQDSLIAECHGLGAVDNLNNRIPIKLRFGKVSQTRSILLGNASNALESAIEEVQNPQEVHEHTANGRFGFPFKPHKLLMRALMSL